MSLISQLVSWREKTYRKKSKKCYSYTSQTCEAISSWVDGGFSDGSVIFESEGGSYDQGYETVYKFELVDVGIVLTYRFFDAYPEYSMLDSKNIAMRSIHDDSDLDLKNTDKWCLKYVLKKYLRNL